MREMAFIKSCCFSEIDILVVHFMRFPHQTDQQSFGLSVFSVQKRTCFFKI